MANKIEFRHQSFWMKAYLAALRRGNSTDDCAKLADEAVQQFKNRE